MTYIKPFYFVNSATNLPSNKQLLLLLIGIILLIISFFYTFSNVKKYTLHKYFMESVKGRNMMNLRRLAI
ncbi:MAG TPA: hypothetical protein DCQ46_01945 [Lachnospiraceae bacterium]|nr:hypothetical protein [Lachnospiraceae bacterium]